MDIISSILIGLLLGAIQGVTEWLPVSSSGHLAAAQIEIGYVPPIFFDLILHMGSVAVLIFIFRNDLFYLPENDRPGYPGGCDLC